MNSIRIGLVLVVALLIVFVSVFQMQLRGYQEVDRINAYVLYINEDIDCQDQLYTTEGIEYRIVCENQYLLKSGLSEYYVIDALELELVDFPTIEPYLTFE